ncbi:hypothetical protein Tcan_15064 [Toxocara canis]|uniref:Uncharacterized protein n=1 Tax=Toxocara canis TaxID=6265 RepID=A0A0B2VFL7_TOXCA|nr:hypothetical protein Tcan_15064 [Toxocara canis]
MWRRQPQTVITTGRRCNLQKAASRFVRLRDTEQRTLQLEAKALTHTSTATTTLGNRLSMFASGRSCASEDLVRELEKEVYKYRSRCEQLENIIRIQQQDIDSLRYEIRWKDGRIEFLQSQLAELDAAHSTSSHSP